MALSFKKSYNTYELYNALGVDPGLVTEAEKLGLVMVFFPKFLRFTASKPIFKSDSGEGFFNTYEVSLSVQQMQLIAQLKNNVAANPILVTALCTKIETWLKHGIDQYHALAAPVIESSSLLSQLPPLKKAPKAKPDPVPASVGYPVFPREDRLTAPVVPLKEATQMYQPVAGTDSSSRYFMVGATDKVKLAARLTSENKLSLRFEAAKEKDLLVLPLVAMGFSGGKMGHYSVHIMAGSQLMASRIIGGVLSALETDVLTPVPHVKEIIL